MSSFEPVDSPAVQLVAELRAERERGRSFPLAWEFATRRVLSRVEDSWERKQWVTVFDETSEVWWACYEGRETSSDLSALMSLEGAIL